MLSFQRSLVTLVMMLCISAISSQSQTPASASAPLTFEINRGQSAPEVHFLARAREGEMFFTSEGLIAAVPHTGSLHAV